MPSFGSTPNWRPIWTAASGQPPHESDKHAKYGPPPLSCTSTVRRDSGGRQRHSSAVGGIRFEDVRNAVGVGVHPLQLLHPAVAAVAQPEQDTGQQRRGEGADEHADLDVLVARGPRAVGELADE